MTQNQDTPVVSSRMVIIAYVVVVLSMGVDSFGIVCVQILDGIVPEFELNAWRYIWQGIQILPMIIYHRPSLWIPKKQLLNFAIFVGMHNILNILYYTAPIYVAVGTLEGCRVALTIVFNSIIAMFMKQGTKAGYLSAVVCIIGVLLMSQPDFMFEDAGLYRNPPTNWTSECRSNLKRDITMIHELDHKLKNMTLPLPGTHQEVWIGYALIVSAALGVSLTIIVIQKITEDVEFYVLVFTSAGANLALSLFGMILVERPMMPKGPFCLTMLMYHAFAASDAIIVAAFSLQYISGMVYAMLTLLPSVLLVIYQYTFMANINPGLGNWLEIVGAAMCLFGSITGPAWDLISDFRSKRDEGYSPVEYTEM